MARALLVTSFRPTAGQEIHRFFSESGYAIHAVTSYSAWARPGDSAPSRTLIDRHLPGLAFCMMDQCRVTDLISLLRATKPAAILHAPLDGVSTSQSVIENHQGIINGTLNWLEATRQCCPEIPFIFLSTTRVYGDRADTIAMAELATRFQFTDPAFAHGISEEFPIDQSTHSLAGAVAVACDVLVQEFGRSFHLPTCCLRVDSVCDPKNLISDQHDFLSQIGHGCRTSTPYSIYGHHGKQVREVIHARDVASFMHAFIDHPRQAEVYNLGAGETQACSLVEAIKLLEDLTGKPLGQDYHEQPAPGEPMIYFCDSRKVKRDYPGWIVTKSLTEMALEVAGRKDCGVHSRD